MAKKNPYITTIGFNKEDPDHVYVADFLNSMGRGKGQYIVKAIMAYQNPGGVTIGHMVVPAVDYEKIRDFVLQVMEDGNDTIQPHMKKTLVQEPMREHRKDQKEKHEKVELPDLDEMAVNDILASLSVFR